MSRSLLLSLSLAFALSGCGLLPLGDDPGGDSNLPTSGGGAYRKLPIDFSTPADEPFVFGEPVADFLDPTVLPRRGGGFRFWMERREGMVEQIWAAELTSLTQLPSLPQPVLVADQPWEQGRVAAPSVVELSGGDLLLYYEAGAPAAPAIGFARSSDGGNTWTKDPQNPIVPAAARPGAALIDNTVALLYAEPGGGNLLRIDADAAAPTRFGAATVVLSPVAGDPGFQGRKLTDPYLVVRRTPAGRVHFSLFFAALTPAAPNMEASSAIGCAGSFDGVTWTRFLAGAAVLSESVPPEAGPAAVLEPARGILFFHQTQAGRARIAVATTGSR